MNKLKMQSPNLVDANIDKIAALFPSCITENRDENGIVRRAVDFDLLRQELTASLVEGPQERYTLSWPGKNEAILTANAPIAKTLRPCEEESVDFANTKNIFIEGDNLDALKLLQETYLNKVKMIYIDPPYNTGNDFIYEDDFAEDTETFLQRSNQKDEEGNRLVANTEANGRFHSDWLTMIYPRLKLARTLLREDGVIFISVDDNEVHNLRKVCDEIFGGTNFVTTVIWQKVYSPKNSARHFSEDHDYVVVYARNAEIWTPNLLPRTPEMEARYSNQDSDKPGNVDTGFRVFKIDTSNMKDVYYTPDELIQGNLDLFKNHIKPDRSPEDLLFQVFIDWGLDLSLPIAKETIDGKTVFLVDSNALIACFDSGINEELVKKLATHKPLRVVFRDDAFGSDSVKINVEQIFKLLSPATEVKSI